MSIDSTFFLVGEVSTGKSSFLNALGGGILSCASIQRETFSPEYYQFTKSGELKTVSKINKNNFNLFLILALSFESSI
jgi:septin family protein